MKNTIFQTSDGSKSILSGKFGEAYHSRHGALQESLHVFISNGLKYKYLSDKKIAILEMGFGTGLNAALTWEFAERNPDSNISYTGVEAYPVEFDLIKELAYDSLSSCPDFNLLHTLAWNTELQISSNFSFTKSNFFFEELNFKAAFDIIYFDAFAPGCQPELWGEEMMGKMYDALHTGGVLVTYCAKGSFKRALKSVGFRLEKLPGPTGKREMTRATKP